MTQLSYFYIDTHRCGTSDWNAPLVAEPGLPGLEVLAECINARELDVNKVAVLIKDDLLHPLRVQLDRKVAARELDQFLLWKLKRYLPYPIDQVAMRCLPLREPDTYLTFSLPRAWVDGLYELFAARDIHCGYVGGLFVTLLENRPDFKDRLTLGLYDDCYLAARLDARGGYQSWYTRRLPYDAAGSLDTETLIRADLEPLIRKQPDPSPLLLSFAPELDEAFPAIKSALQSMVPGTTVPELRGAAPARFETCMSTHVGSP